MAEPAEQIITRPEELPGVCAHLAAARRFGFDTEFVGEDSYRPELCLLQVATEERLILIDPFSVGPLDAFWEVVVDPGNEVIVHAGREEIRLCQFWSGRRPGKLFDLQIAAGLTGLNYPLGHATLVGQVLGITVPKSETLTEWRDRPLTRRQIAYAFDDVRYLLRLWQSISAELDRLGRTAWAEEEFQRLGRIATDEEPLPARWRKLRGLGALGRRQLAMVQALFEWRERVADRTNRPARIVCRDDLLVEIARRNPSRPRDLQVVRGLAHRYVDEIYAALETARCLPIEACPAVAEREQDPPQVGWLTGILTATLGQLARELRLAPGLTATTADLRLLVRTFVDGEATEARSLLNEGWRREHIRPRLEAILRGEQSLRVVEPQSETPFEFRPYPRE